MCMGPLHFREEYLFSNLAVAIFEYLLVSAAAIPVSSALFVVLVIPRPPEFT